MIAALFARRNATFCYHVHPSVACGGRRGVAQLVARLLWVQDVVGSNPAAPTKTTLRFDEGFWTRPGAGEEHLGASGTTGEPNRRGVGGDSAPAAKAGSASAGSSEAAGFGRNESLSISVCRYSGARCP